MSRADTRARILAAATALGVQQGVSGLSLRAIASHAGLSKALILYHFEGKSSVLNGMAEAIGRRSSARLAAAGAPMGAMAKWRELVHAETSRGEVALLGALALEEAVPAETLANVREAREAAAAGLATAVLATLGLAPRVPAVFLGRLLLRQLDGMCLTASRGGLARDEVEVELDAFALALLSLGR